MAIPKVCGIETEYGIQVVNGDPNPIAASSVLINAYAHDVARQQIGWDFEDEAPGNDARGAAKEGSMPPMVETHLVNTVLTNGARYYVDHAHPEFSSPECRNALEAVRYDRAGEAIVIRSMEAADASSHDGSRLVVYKNNSDGKGNSYGCHENYLMDRETPFSRIVAGITPHFVTRQLFCGAGKVGSETPFHESGSVDFQLSQRAEFFEEQVGLETTLKRPIVNTRDEPHADPHRYRRLHVIVGDANLAEVATFLKLGHHVVGAGHDRGRRADRPRPGAGRPGAGHPRRGRRPDLHPAAADGRRLDGHRPGHPVGALLDRPASTPTTGASTASVPRPSARPCSTGGSRCCTGSRPIRRTLARQVDWVAKLQLLEAYQRPARPAAGTTRGWPPSTCSTTTCVRPGRSSPGSTPSSWWTTTSVAAAVTDPPRTTRAWFRGECLKRWPASVATANWDSLVFDLGSDPLRRVPMMDPLKGTAEHVEALLDGCASPAELVDRLSS